MTATALVTGGAGFIGSNLVLTLLEHGFEVTTFDNLSSGYRENLSRDARFIEGDVRDPHALQRAMARVDIVFHLAASVGNARGLQNPSSDATANVLGTLNVLEAARFTGCRAIVYSSSAAVFGEPRAQPISEEHPLAPLTPYGVSKLAGEKYVLAYDTLYGIRGVALRYFNVYGTRQRYDAYGNVIPIFATRALRGEDLVIFGDGDQTRDFIDVSDIARANLLAAGSEARGVFNIGSGTATTINSLAKMVVRSAESTSAITHGAPRAGDVRHATASIASAAHAFGFRPQTPLETGLEHYVAWLRSELA